MSTLWMDLEPAADPLAGEDDGVLLRRFAERRDREAIGTLFRRHADAVYRMAWRSARNAADAEDIVQTAFMQVLRKPEQYRGDSSVRAWIMGIVVNVARMKCRGESRRRGREDRAAEEATGASPEPASAANPASLDNRELQRALLQAVEGLPERYRLPVWLHYLEGFVFKDVAEVLRVPEKTVRSQIRRALIRLRRSPAVAPYSLGVLGVAAALASVPVQAAPPSLTASLSALIATALPSAAGAALLDRLTSALTAAAQILKGTVATKCSVGVGTAAAVAGGVFWLMSHGPMGGAPDARADEVGRAVANDKTPTAPGFVAIRTDSARDPGSDAVLVYLPDFPDADGGCGGGGSASATGGLRRDPEAGLRPATRLPMRDRQAIRQGGRQDRCPLEYRRMYEQYLRNISDEAVSDLHAEADVRSYGRIALKR